MKHLHRYLFVATLALCLNACNKSLLDQFPEDRISNPSFWKTENDFRSYALGLYNFYGYGVGNDHTNIATNSDESCRSNNVQDERIFNKIVIPNTGGGWSWSYLRSVNIMIREAQQSGLPQANKLHWEAVGRFFRANEYFSKVKTFGEVPWIGSELNVNSDELFGSRSPRALLMDSVLADLNFAVANLRETDQPNQVSRAVAQALKSRICLFEGTFRKYHTELNLGDAQRWFTECVAASEAIMNSGKYQLSANYRTIYTAANLAGNTETILYKQYEPGVIVNIRTRSLILGVSATSMAAGTKDAIENYLCADGLPYGISPTHPKAINGEAELIEEEFVGRDPRMSMTFGIPYDGTPAQNPALVSGNNNQVPPFQPSYPGEGYLPSATGYHPYKWWTLASPYDDVNGILDAALFALNEMLLNYAEAKAELGDGSNTMLNQSINKLRTRAGMPPLTVELASGWNDPRRQRYAPEISSLLWELRRERQAELMLDGFRLDDILRWKKASYLSKPFVGAYVDLQTRPALAYNPNGTPKATITLGDREGNVLTGATKGYVLPYGNQKQPQYSDNDLKRYYLPIPTQELVLNPKLSQSPGW